MVYYNIKSIEKDMLGRIHTKETIKTFADFEKADRFFSEVSKDRREVYVLEIFDTEEEYTPEEEFYNLTTRIK